VKKNTLAVLQALRPRNICECRVLENNPYFCARDIPVNY
jgi:hypothetical protein